MLRREKMIGTRHGKIAGADRKYALSSGMAEERRPQLERAIELLSNAHPPPAKSRQVKEVDNQLSIF
jgi:hypothetical protein